jgi:hypothetical protein
MIFLKPGLLIRWNLKFLLRRSRNLLVNFLNLAAFRLCGKRRLSAQLIKSLSPRRRQVAKKNVLKIDFMKLGLQSNFDLYVFIEA